MPCPSLLAVKFNGLNFCTKKNTKQKKLKAWFVLRFPILSTGCQRLRPSYQGKSCYCPKRNKPIPFVFSFIFGTWSNHLNLLIGRNPSCPLPLARSFIFLFYLLGPKITKNVNKEKKTWRRPRWLLSDTWRLQTRVGIYKLPEESQEEQIKTWRTAVSKFISTWCQPLLIK